MSVHYGIYLLGMGVGIPFPVKAFPWFQTQINLGGTNFFLNPTRLIGNNNPI